MLLAAKQQRYVGFSDLLSEFSNAPSTSEWKSLGPTDEFTRACIDFALAMEEGKDAMEAYERLITAT